ncbi:MAG: cysteine desulfurase [Verrucomicrobia bacterium]|nr:cysteine desulfurase [Verrucomicrobiota bacterium]
MNSRETTTAPDGYPIDRIRGDFPVLQRAVGAYPLTYLDSAATSLKPQVVIDRVSRHYAEESANIHRGVHLLSEEATAAYEAARDNVRAFINADSVAEIIVTSGTTAGINLVAHAFGQTQIKAGDDVLISNLEHHSNIVPWQQLRERVGCNLKIIPITDSGELDLDAYLAMLGPRTKLVSIAHVSNSLGTVNPVRQVIDAAHAHGAKVLLDAAQSVPCRPVDVAALDCDFLAFSGHKLFGPTGVGILYGKRALLESLPPFLGGGDMILSVTFEETTYNRLPYKFEAGTPPIAQLIGLGAAVDYVRAIGMSAIQQYEKTLLDAATERLSAIPGVRLIGTAGDKAAIVSFLIDDVHPHDIGSILDSQGIAIRAGHHCTQPVMQRFGIAATARAAFSIYNTFDDVDRLVQGVQRVKELFG